MAKNKGKQRTATNTAESATLSVNERILQECYKLYADEEKGGVHESMLSFCTWLHWKINWRV